MADPPSLAMTIAILIAAALVAGIANWQLRRDFLDRIKYVPWFAVQFCAVALCLIMAAHLVSLLTGQPLHSSRAGY